MQQTYASRHNSNSERRVIGRRCHNPHIPGGSASLGPGSTSLCPLAAEAWINLPWDTAHAVFSHLSSVSSSTMDRKDELLAPGRSFCLLPEMIQTCPRVWRLLPGSTSGQAWSRGVTTSSPPTNCGDGKREGSMDATWMLIRISGWRTTQLA